MSDEGEKDMGKDAERPARPEPAGSRRARRDAARAEGEQSGKTGSAKGKSAKGKSAGSAPAGRTDGTSPPIGTKRDKTEEKLPLPKRIARYIREVVAELRKVIWPTRKQMVTYTIVVLAFVAFMVGLVALLDWVFGQAMFALFG
ncbi:MAG: preprotein translocase subunit SecE [Actinophytocola sp.]|nr:preprotein translocase subunit SecE [Actinophytocola sp.]